MWRTFTVLCDSNTGTTDKTTTSRTQLIDQLKWFEHLMLFSYCCWGIRQGNFQKDLAPYVVVQIHAQVAATPFVEGYRSFSWRSRLSETAWSVMVRPSCARFTHDLEGSLVCTELVVDSSSKVKLNVKLPKLFTGAFLRCLQQSEDWADEIR